MHEYTKLGDLAIMYHLKWKYIFDPLSSNSDNNLQALKDKKSVWKHLTTQTRRMSDVNWSGLHLSLR